MMTNNQVEGKELESVAENRQTPKQAAGGSGASCVTAADRSCNVSGGCDYAAKFQESGIVLVNKPAGISSNAVVNIVKRALGAKKCGHLGTLDLEGEGLLPVTVNAATKLFDYFLNKDKTYETVFKFGLETDTLDASGQVLKTQDCDITLAQMQAVAAQMIGKYSQMPPQYSAKKVGGKNAYQLARSGQCVKLSPKEVEIFEIDVLQQIEKNTFRLRVTCSSGTYIRSLARDMAAKLGTYGIMHCILRTRCGVFCIKDAYTLNEIKSGKFSVVPCDVLFDYPILELSEIETQKLLNGQFLDIRTLQDLQTLKNKQPLSKNLSKNMGTNSSEIFGENLITNLYEKSYFERKYKLYGDGKFLGIGKIRKISDSAGEFLKLDLRLI